MSEQIKNSTFCCPICRKPLGQEGRSLRCAAGHSFDLGAQGYVNLLVANRRHSAAPGDDKGMVRARRAFLQAGWYQPFSDELNRLAEDCLASAAHPLLLDAGCGEGYYTGRLAHALGPGVRIAAFDISKSAVQSAAKSYPGIEFAVASAFSIPMVDGVADCIVNIFAPMAQREFARVLHPGGRMIYAVPGARHLFGLKEILYERPYENPVREVNYEGFRFLSRVPVRSQCSLSSPQEIQALFAMTPYYWKTPKEGAQRLEQLSRLETEIEFDFLLYERI